ncbi:hypothetical protein LTR27_010207 [Elasticomyces elasticus]|nr:hypothetical protein LTR27_010207 [Elasticomyces elasticus]
MATPITFTSLLQAAFKACTFALINGGLLAFAFEIYGLLCRRLASPNPELVEQRRKLTKDECNRYDPFAHMEVADWWQFIRILLMMLHLVLVVVAALENGHDWRLSLAFVVEISGFLFGLVTIKSTWQWFRRLLKEGIYAAAEDLGWYLRVLHAAIVAIGCGLLATKAAVMPDTRPFQQIPMQRRITLQRIKEVQRSPMNGLGVGGVKNDKIGEVNKGGRTRREATNPRRGRKMRASRHAQFSHILARQCPISARCTPGLLEILDRLVQKVCDRLNKYEKS